MANRRCPDCGRYHSHKGCENDAHPKVIPSAPRHGHSLHDNQPRVKHQVSRKMRTGQS